MGSEAPLFNDLEPAAVAVEPRLGELLSVLRDGLSLHAHVTGSGAACFVICADAAAARDTAERIRARTGFEALAVKTRPG